MSVADETPNSQTSETEQQNSTESETSTATESQTETESLVTGDKTEETTTVEFVPLTAEDITFSEGFEVQPEFRDDFLKIVNDQELSHKDRTQALTGLYEKAALAASEASSKQWSDTQTEWQNAVKADPEIGGDKLPATLSAVNKLVTEYGSDKLPEVFALTGAGNHPEMIKFLNKIANVLTEGRPIQATAPVNSESTAAERLFPSMKGK